MIDEDELESIFSATYFEDFVDSCENLPFQVLKSLYHERLDSVDLDSEETLRDIEDLVYSLLERCESSGQNFLFSQMLGRLEELADYAEEAASERCGVIGELEEYLEEKARVLELDRKNMITKQPIVQPALVRDDALEADAGPNVKVETPVVPASKPVGRPPKNRKSKRKSTPLPVRDIDVFADQSIEEVCQGGGDVSDLLDHAEAHGGCMKSSSPAEVTSSPKERRRRKNGVKRRRKTRTPRTYGKTRSHLSKAFKYCICKEDCPGDMIGCDNRGSCPVEWFHFACLQLTSKPRGKWYCPMCRGSRANVLKTTEAVAENDCQEDMETNVF